MPRSLLYFGPVAGRESKGIAVIAARDTLDVSSTGCAAVVAAHIM